jgi:DNA-directed RNA polymerase
MGHAGRQLKADQHMVDAIVADARWCVERGVFWNDYNCDWRGRINALQDLNIANADHVRALFKFAEGAKLGGNVRWLMIHCAKCAGMDKESDTAQIRWVDANREDIQRIAANPIDTFDKDVLGGKGWKDADEPLQFVAACRELAAAWANPKNFMTHLPIGFDGSCNGIQHLALLAGDLRTAEQVNLCGTGDADEHPHDVYAQVIARAIELIKADNNDHAAWWRERLQLLSEKQKRKLLKSPIMTFAYGVTVPGAQQQIAESYIDLFRHVEPVQPSALPLTSPGSSNYGPERLGALRWHEERKPKRKKQRKNKKNNGWREQQWLRDILDNSGRAIGVHEEWRRVPKGVFGYLAETVLRACKMVLVEPQRIMDYLSDLAKHCADQGRFLEWTSQTGFPVTNRYNKMKLKTVTCMRGAIHRAEHQIQNATDEIDVDGAKSSAAANFTHTQDATHLAKVVNAAASEGIVNILTIHDCFYCLATQADRFLEIILSEMASMYENNDPIADLGKRNDPEGIVPVPLKGTLLEWKCTRSTFAGMSPNLALGRYRVQMLTLDRVRKSKKAFNN